MLPPELPNQQKWNVCNSFNNSNEIRIRFMGQRLLNRGFKSNRPQCVLIASLKAFNSAEPNFGNPLI